MTETAETRAWETALLLAGWPPDQQDKIIGDAFDAAMRKHGLTEPTREMLDHAARVYALIGEIEQMPGGTA
jgi:hypothetical protein